MQSLYITLDSAPRLQGLTNYMYEFLRLLPGLMPKNGKPVMRSRHYSTLQEKQYIISIKAYLLVHIWCFNSFTIWYGKKGGEEYEQPCPVPLWRGKLGEVWSSVMTQLLGELYNNLIQFRKWSLNPNICNVV